MWHARLVKTRTLAQKSVLSGHVRVNRIKIRSASHKVSVGAVLTIALDQRVFVLRVVAFADHRGPASSARLLYDDLNPPIVGQRRSPPAPQRDKGSRPTKRERRQLHALKHRYLDE
jgi:ribosome-associated heat shock protein Hsp15